MKQDQSSLGRPPLAERRPHPFTTHGQTLVDDYSWLKDENWQEVLRDPAVLRADIRAHLEAENNYADSVLSRSTALRAELVREMRGRIKEDDSTVPAPDGPFAYFTKFREGGQHSLIARSARDGGAETVILDGDALAADSDYFRFGNARHSPDHRFEAWSADTRGSEYFTIRVRDWNTGEDIPDIIENADRSIVWGADSRSFLYVKLDDNHRPLQVFRHVLGTAQSQDVLVYEERDSGWFVHIKRSASGRFCVIASGDHETSEQSLLDLEEGRAFPRLVSPRQTGVEYSVADREDQLFILTNADHAIDFKIAVAPLTSPDKANWRDLIPHRPGSYLVDMTLFANHLVRHVHSNALPSIAIRNLTTFEEHVIAFEEHAYSLNTFAGSEFDTAQMRFSYSSMTTPTEIFDYDMDLRQRTLRKRQVIPSGHDPLHYVTDRVMAMSDDGAEVPVSILHRRGLMTDGSAPLLLYGYGSYGLSMSASFSGRVLSLVDRGFVFAIAHVRGGSDKGRGWYLDGKRERKTNTFDDFIAAAKRLIELKYTSPKKIVGYGGSAGGMLMGAVANRAGDLFAGIAAQVPFVDVLNTMLDATLPLTPPEWPEWGNPIADEQAFRTILSYSPYENIRAQRYPAILAMAGLADSRVTYWEAAKWVARLRATMTGGGPVLLRTNMGAGHGGASGRFSELEEIAIVYAFAIWSAGTA